MVNFISLGGGGVCWTYIAGLTPFSFSKIKDVKHTASVFAVVLSSLHAMQAREVLSSLHAMQAREYHYNRSTVKPTLNGHAFFPYFFKNILTYL